MLTWPPSIILYLLRILEGLDALCLYDTCMTILNSSVSHTQCLFEGADLLTRLEAHVWQATSHSVLTTSGSDWLNYSLSFHGCTKTFFLFVFLISVLATYCSSFQFSQRVGWSVLIYSFSECLNEFTFSCTRRKFATGFPSTCLSLFRAAKPYWLVLLVDCQLESSIQVTRY